MSYKSEQKLDRKQQYEDELNRRAARQKSSDRAEKRKKWKINIPLLLVSIGLAGVIMGMIVVPKITWEAPPKKAESIFNLTYGIDHRREDSGLFFVNQISDVGGATEGSGIVMDFSQSKFSPFASSEISFKVPINPSYDRFQATVSILSLEQTETDRLLVTVQGDRKTIFKTEWNAASLSELKLDVPLEKVRNLTITFSLPDQWGTIFFSAQTYVVGLFNPIVSMDGELPEKMSPELVAQRNQSLTGTWTGDYLDADNRRIPFASLELTGTAEGVVTGILTFQDESKGIQGSFSVNGTMDGESGFLNLQAGDWIEQPQLEDAEVASSYGRVPVYGFLNSKTNVLRSPQNGLLMKKSAGAMQ